MTSHDYSRVPQQLCVELGDVNGKTLRKESEINENAKKTTKHEPATSKDRFFVEKVQKYVIINFEIDVTMSKKCKKVEFC